MALFKIEKGLAANLSKNRPNAVEGYCYVTTDDGKFYIDIGNGTASSANRIVLNAGTADKLAKEVTLSLNGKVTGSAKFDGSKDVAINVDTSEIDEAISALPKTASKGIKIVNNDIQHTNSITAGTASEGGSSRTLDFGDTFNVPGVTYDAQGHIKSKSSVTLTLPANPNTDTKVTSAANHYAPAEDTSAALSVDASGATSAAAWNSTNLVTGVNLKRDAKGHVVGVTVDSIKMPANPDTNTTYTLSGQFTDNNTAYTTTLTPSSGTATTAQIPLMTAATSSAAGAPGLVPAPGAGENDEFLRGDGTWATPTNTNTKMYLYRQTSGYDNDYPLLVSRTLASSIGTADTNDSKSAVYAVFREDSNNNATLLANPAKGTITAPGGFIGTADAAKEVPWSGVTGKLNATASEAGLIKVSSVNTSAVTVNAESTNAGRYYSVELNSDGKAIVNVPWSDTNTDTGATSVEVTGTGNAITTASYDSASRKLTLTKGATYNNYSLPQATTSVLGGVKIGSNISVESGVISLTKANVTAALGYTPPTKDTDTGATTVTVSGSGNAVTSATYDASTRTITLTKGSTFNNYSHPAGNAASKESGLYKISTDATSHINSVTKVTKSDITALGIPGSDTNTAHAHTAGAGLVIGDSAGGTSGTTTYSLAESGVTAGTYGPTADVSGTNNTTINVPQITVDEYGRVTSVTNRVYTSKNTDINTTYSAGTGLSLSGTTFNHSNSVTAKTTYEQSTAAPGYGGTFKIAEPKYDAQGHITGVQVSTITMPSKQTIPTSFTIAANGAGDGVVLLEKQNGSNAVTYNVSHEKMLNSPDDLTVNKYTSQNSTTSISGSGGSGIIKIPQITVDEYGHVKKASDESVTITLPTVPTTLKNPQALTFGSQTYDGSAAKTITAADLGLSNALHFKGVVSSLPATTVDYVDGDVILVGNKEYVCSSSAWVELGDESSFSLKDHTHNYAGSSSAGGAATSANKVNKSLTVKLNGGSTEGTNLFTFNGSTAKSINITPDSIGAAAASHGTHVSYGTTATAVGSTASAGSATTVSRSDHTHSLSKSAVTTALGYTPPTQDTDTGATSVEVTGSGNAITSASYDATSRKITLTKDKTFNNYSHPAGNAASKTSKFYKFSTDSTSHINSVTEVTKADITGLGIPGSDTNYYHTRVYNSGLKISTGTGVSDMYVPAGTTSSLGVVKQHTSTDCTTYTSDDGATTPAAVKQAVQKFIKAGSNVTLTWNDDSSSDAYGYTITSSYTNTKNTAGATNTSSKIYLIGATAQNANPQTYSHDTVYVDTDGLLYSGSKKVSTEGHTHSGSYSKSATATGSTNASGTVANASITPSGTVSKPTFTGTEAGHSHTFKGDSHGHTVTPSTTDVYSITSVGTMFKAEVSGEVLILTAGTAPTRSSSAIKAYTGLTVNGNTQTGTITETKITPAGSVSQPTFTGTAASHNHTFNGSGHTHTITLSDATVTVS